MLLNVFILYFTIVNLLMILCYKTLKYANETGLH